MNYQDWTQYIGYVERAPSTIATYKFATLRPLLLSDQTGTRWFGPVTDAATRFPIRGLVHWHDAPASARLQTIWQFSVDRHAASESRGYPEHFECVAPMEPIELIDCRAWKDELALRSALTSEGIVIIPKPLARRIMLWLASGLFVGPLFLKPADTVNRWILDRPEATVDAGRMPVLHIPTEHVQKVSLNGNRWLLGPAYAGEPGQCTGVQNWASDEQVAGSVLRRLRRLDRHAVEAMQVTDRVFTAYLKRLASSNLLANDRELEEARGERLANIHAAIARNAQLLNEAVEVLRARPEVQAQIEEWKEQEHQRLREEIEAQIDEELGAQRAKLTSLTNSVEESERRLEDLIARVSEKQRDLTEVEQAVERHAASFEEALTARVEEIARRPEMLFAESAIMRAASWPLRGGLQQSGSDKADSPTPDASDDALEFRDSVPVPLDEPYSSNEQHLPNEQSLVKELTGRALAEGTSLYAIWALHGAIGARQVPVLIGERSYDILRVYAAAAAGGRLHWVPVGSSLLEPQDLLGRPDPTGTRIVPHPGGILDLVLKASTIPKTYVVVLEGFNRAPIDGYLLPLLEAVRAARDGDTARAIPIASPTVLRTDDPYRSMSRVTWPPSVLLACTVSFGMTTLPVPAEAWRHLVLIDADARGRPERSLAALASRPGPTQMTEVAASIWASLWPDATADARDEAEAPLARLADALGLSRLERRGALEMHRVLTRSRIDPQTALEIAAESALIPRSRVDGGAISTALRTELTDSTTRWNVFHEEAQRLRG